MASAIKALMRLIVPSSVSAARTLDFTSEHVDLDPGSVGDPPLLISEVPSPQELRTLAGYNAITFFDGLFGPPVFIQGAGVVGLQSAFDTLRVNVLSSPQGEVQPNEEEKDSHSDRHPSDGYFNL